MDHILNQTTLLIMNITFMKKTRFLIKNSAIVLNMLRDVVHDKDGTGKKARVNGYTVYGKTGTVRQLQNGAYDKNQHNALFIGILGDPKICSSSYNKKTKRQRGFWWLPCSSCIW